jgi:hypothetical protein
MRVASIILLFTAVLPASTWAQGLVDLVGGRDSGQGGRGSAIETRKRLGNGRLDLEISPNVQALAGEPSQRTINLGASLKWNPVCGKFDLKADFAALYGKEAREEYLKAVLGAITGEILGSAMELLCQAQPTACSLALNDNLATNLKLLYHQDLCQTWEQAVYSGARRGRAEAVLRCIDEKQKQGKTKDEAEKACLSENPPVTGFDGRVVGELDLNKEIRRYLQFSDGGSELLSGMTQGRTVGRDSIKEEPRPNGIADRYEATRDDYLRRWTEALGSAKAGAGRGPGATDLATLVPPGAPPVTERELALIAKRPEGEVAAFLGSMTAAAALLKLTREMNEIERKLEALKDTPAIDDCQEHKAYLEALVQRIRSERERMLRLYADQERLERVLSAGHALGQAEVTRSRLDIMRRAAVAEATKTIRTGTRPFGTPESSLPQAGSSSGRTRNSAASSASCDTCGLEYSFGSGGNGP